MARHRRLGNPDGLDMQTARQSISMTRKQNWVSAPPRNQTSYSTAMSSTGSSLSTSLLSAGDGGRGADHFPGALRIERALRSSLASARCTPELPWLMRRREMRKT
jgi:hypothetical protein